MADFVAVLKKTLDGLTETTPQMREKVYEKARLTIAGKLAAMNPPPPAGVIDRQKRALEDAIASIEKEFAPPGPTVVDPLTELENVFASLKNPEPLSSFKPQPRPEPAPRPVMPATPPTPVIPPAPLYIEPMRQVAPRPMERQEPRLDDDPLEDEGELDFDDDPDEPETIAADTRPRRERNLRAPLVALLVLVVAAGAGYGVWANRSAFSGMLGSGDVGTAETQPETPVSPPATDVAAVAPVQPVAPATETPAEAPAPAAAAPEDEEKFTQRLNADGSEVDPGPAGGEPAIGEGTSVASVTQDPTAPTPPVAQPEPAATQPDPAVAAADTPPAPGDPAPADPAAVPPSTVPGPAAPPPATATVDAAIPVGQRAIFYEERTNVAEASAEPGSVVWSLVQESPGGDLPPETAIRAEATIPGKDVQLRMTIRRNADQTLPASHIIEVIFLTPNGFDGGGIDNVLRISMKGSEQEAGSPLIGIPVKIADGFFLVALNDAKPEIDANLTLLRRQSWIDVPVQYKSGRRALFTMEKGIPGAKVFDEALKAWEAAATTASTPG